MLLEKLIFRKCVDSEKKWDKSQLVDTASRNAIFKFYHLIQLGCIFRCLSIKESGNVWYYSRLLLKKESII